MLTKTSSLQSSNVNLLLSRPFLGLVLVLDSVLLKVEQLTSWLQSGPQKVWLFPPVIVTVSVKQLRSRLQLLSL